MFGVSSARRWGMALVLSLTVLTLIGLAGCSKEEVVDPYAYDSVRRIMDGDTLSVGFLFEIDAPAMEYIKGDVGIMRNGNLLNFLVGEDLENRAPNLQGTLLGVKKTFTPQPTHLVIQRIKRDGLVVQDSIPAPTGLQAAPACCAPAPLPRICPAPPCPRSAGRPALSRKPGPPICPRTRVIRPRPSRALSPTSPTVSASISRKPTKRATCRSPPRRTTAGTPSVMNVSWRWWT
jgi:hypothetical protein